MRARLAPTRKRQDGALIGPYVAIVDGDDDVAFGLLIGLMGPSAPVRADELWDCVSGFLRDLRL